MEGLISMEKIKTISSWVVPGWMKRPFIRFFKKRYDLSRIVRSLLEAKRPPSVGDTPLAIAQRLNHELDFPTASYPTIHVAGTNGKGSVATKIGKVLELSGYTVGVYTSPHLFSLHERITINGLPISEEDVVDGLAPLFALNETLSLKLQFFLS